MGICTQNLRCENQSITVHSNTPHVISLYKPLKVIGSLHQKSKPTSSELLCTASTALTSGDTLRSCKSYSTPILCRLINRKTNKKSTPHPVCTI